MTWVAATSTYNSGVLVTDTRITLTWRDAKGRVTARRPEYRFGVCKARPLASNIVAGFSGSIDIGLDVLENLAATVPDNLSQTNLDLESAYGQFYENLKKNYHSYPKDLRKYEGLSVLMMGVQPGRRMKIPAPGYSDGYEQDVAWSGAHTLGCKIIAPKRHNDKWKFEAFGTMLNSPWMPPGESRDIGSVSGRDEYAQALSGILSANSVFQTYGGDSGVTAMVMADLLTSKIHREVDSSVSKHLFVFAVGVDGTYVRDLNGLFPDPAPEIAYMLDEYKELRRKHGIASAATGVG